MVRFIIFICAVLFSFLLNAQNRYLDSLEHQLTAPKGTAAEKMKLYELLVEHYRIEQLYDKASDLNADFLRLARHENNPVEITKSHVYQGIIWNNQDQFDKATPYIDSAKVSAATTDNQLARAYVTYLSSSLSRSINDVEKAMAYGIETLMLLEQSQEDLYLEFKQNYILYGIFTEWNDLDSSKKYLNKAIDSALKSGNKNDLSNAYTAMAVIYTYAYDRSKQKDDYMSVLTYCDMAARLYNEFPGQVGVYTYAMTRNNKASYLLRYSEVITSGIREEIEYNIREALGVLNALPHAQVLQATSLGMLSDLAKMDGNLALTEQYLLKAYAVLLTQNPVYYGMAMKVVGELSNLYETMGDLPQALAYQKKKLEYNVLLFNDAEAQTVKFLEAQFEFEKKEQEVQALKESAEFQRKQKMLYAGLGVIGLIGAFFMFRSYHYRLRYSIQHEKQLSIEKKEAELLVELEKEEQQRLKAEQQVLALQQEKLQNEVMVSQLHLQHKNEVLHQLKEKLNNDQTLNINQIIRDQNLLDSDFEKTKFQIQELHPNFFNVLSEKAAQKLTPLDIKYCAYFYIGLETKQVANLLHVQPKSVRMTKYRLKQKFELGKESDLIGFLKEII